MKKSKNYQIAAALICAVLFVFAAFAGIVINFTASRAQSADGNVSAERVRVVGYLPDWSYSEYKNIDFSALTHINISFCNVNSMGEIACGIPDAEMKAIVDKAHGVGAKVIAALGGGGYGDPYRNLISSADKIASLNEKIVAFCEKHNLDGVDLDIELNSSDSIWKNYGEWVTELRKICDARGWDLSTATAQWVAGNVSPETFSLFDFVNVMAYDNDSNGSKSHSSYEFAVQCLNYFHTTKGVPKQKLVLGVPFYGRGYDESGNLDWKSYLSFKEIIQRDEANFNEDSYMGVAYTGASSMRDKCELAKQYGGIMIWEITLDADGEYSLLSLIKSELSGSDEGGEEDGGEPTDIPPKQSGCASKVDGSGACAFVFAAVIAVVAIVLLKNKLFIRR